MLRANQAIIKRIAAALIAKRSLDQTALAELLASVPAPDQSVGAWVLSRVDDCIRSASGNVRAMVSEMAGPL